MEYSISLGNRFMIIQTHEINSGCPNVRPNKVASLMSFLSYIEELNTSLLSYINLTKNIRF